MKPPQCSARMFILVSMLLVAGQADPQTGGATNLLPATPKEPASLAEAAGRYVGAVEQLNVLKSTRCGYALKRQVPSYEKVVADEIVVAFPPEKRKEVLTALQAMKDDVTRQGRALFDQMYTYYTQQEYQDKNTACGFITGAFITIRKMNAEAFQRKAMHE